MSPDRNIDQRLKRRLWLWLNKINMANVTYTSCCIHVTGVSLDSTTNEITFTLSNGNTIVTDAINISTAANTFITSGLLIGNNMQLSLNDGSTVLVDLTALNNTYTAGTNVSIAANVITVDPIAEVGLGTSLIKDFVNRSFKTLTVDTSLTIVDSGNLITLGTAEPIQITVVLDNTTTALTTKTTHYRNVAGLVGSTISLPDVSTVAFGTEYHIFALSKTVIKTVTTGAEIVPTIASPHTYDSALYTNTMSMKSGDFYIVRKQSTASYIISKQ
jgi:hypothetical protein